MLEGGHLNPVYGGNGDSIIPNSLLLVKIAVFLSFQVIQPDSGSVKNRKKPTIAFKAALASNESLPTVQEISCHYWRDNA